MPKSIKDPPPDTWPLPQPSPPSTQNICAKTSPKKKSLKVILSLEKWHECLNLWTPIFSFLFFNFSFLFVSYFLRSRVRKNGKKLRKWIKCQRTYFIFIQYRSNSQIPIPLILPKNKKRRKPKKDFFFMSKIKNDNKKT